MNASRLQALEVISLQDELTATWHARDPSAGGDDLQALVRENHLSNFQLWHEEDIARRDDLGPLRVRDAKRAIDGFNQQRNDCIENIDRRLVAELDPPTANVPFNSETPGMMIDRLSILSLKAYHMNEEVQRLDAAADHTARCAAKLDTIGRQRADLATALDELLAEVDAGTRSFRAYFQFKMYNDPDLNPQLRDAGKAPAA